MSPRIARLFGARVWAAVLVTLATRTAWSAPEDELPDPPLSPTGPTVPAATPGAPAPAVPPPPRVVPPPPAPREPSGPVPWPTARGARATESAPPPPPSAPTPAAAAAPVPAATTTSPSVDQPSETSVGGYGEALVFLDRDRNLDGQIPWLVLSFAHRPVDWFRIFLAAELEQLSTFGMEQAFLEIAPHPAFGVRAGLLLLPLGIINQWHAPPTFLTVARPLTDELIIPTTWRELGLGVFGDLGGEARYQLQLVAGLDAAGFSADAPLRGGRGNGRGLAAHDAAFVGRLELGRLPSGFALGVGGTWGGASGGHPELAGVSVGLAEADARYLGNGFDVRAELAELFIVNSYLVNDYLGLLGQDAVPARGRGFYAQAGYDVLDAAGDGGSRQALVFFAGYENVNPRTQMSPYNYNPPTITAPGQKPPNAPSSPQSFVRGGIDYRPRPWIAVKMDVLVALDGEGPPYAPPVTAAGAPGTPRPLPTDVAEAARGKTRVGFAFAFMF